MSKWQKVMFTADCDPDGDGWCGVRDIDPCECDCIGPTQDGIEYKEIDGVLYGRKQKGKAVKTIDCTPKWQDVLPVLIAAIENGSAKGRASAMTELQRMAQLADRANAA